MRLAWLISIVGASALASPAAARCVLPTVVTSSAEEAAKYLHGNEDLIVDGIVSELPRGDNSLFQRIDIKQYLKGAGPESIDLWPGPGKPVKHDILNTDEWGRIDAPDGARVVTALRRTPYGWTVGECAYKALAVPGVEEALRNGRWVVRAKRGH